MRSHLSLFILVSFTIAACAPAIEEPMEEPDTTEADVEAINQVREQEVAAINAADVEGDLAIRTDDAVHMPPNEPPVMGKEAIRSWMQAFLDQFTIQNFTASSQEIVVAGDWAFEHYSFNETLVPKAGGESIEDSGQCIHIYQRQPDGSWKIARDIWNSDNPQ